MHVLVLIGLLHFYECKEVSKPRSVNLALETIVEFDHNDNSADVEIIDKVRGFLDRIKTVIGKNKVNYRRSAPSKMRFSDFVIKLLDILRSYDDSDLEDVLAVFDEEIRRYHYKGCKFHELVENAAVRKSMTDNLEKVKNAPANTVKKKLRDMLDKFQTNNMNLIQTAAVHYVNSLYGDKTDSKFREILDKLSAYKSKSKRSNLNLVKMVRDGVRSLIFDHYSRLNHQMRRDLKIKLDTFWHDFVHPEKNFHLEWKFPPLDRDDKSREISKDGLDNHEMRMYTTERKHTTERDKHISRQKHKKDSKPKKHKRREKTKRHSEERTTRDRVTIMTLYPEAITVKRRHKSKTTKLPGLSKFLREGKSSKSPKTKFKKKKQKVRQIISQHEAIIDVRKDLGGHFFKVSDESFKDSTSSAEITTKAQKQRKRYRAVNRSPDTVSRTTKRHLNQIPNRLKILKHIPIIESNEGLSISLEDSELTKKSFRKSNTNDTIINITSANTSNTGLVADVNVINRINDLEKELKVVKAQIRAKDDFGATQFEPLDFWEGTTKIKSETTSTTKQSTTTKATTTTKPKTTITSTIRPTTLSYNTFNPVFRTNDSNFEVKVPKTKKKKTTLSIEEKLDPKQNFTGLRPTTTTSDIPTLNTSADIDYLNDLHDGIDPKIPSFNITGVEDIERYLNETKPLDGDEKTHTVVRKKMLEQLKGIFEMNPEDKNFTVPLDQPMQMVPFDDATGDPLNFLDAAGMDDDLK